MGHHTCPGSRDWDSRASLLEPPALPAALIQPPLHPPPPPPPGLLPLLPLFVIPLSSRLFPALLQLLTAIIQGTDAPADCSAPLPAADRGFNDSPGRARAAPHLCRLPGSPQHPSSKKHLRHPQGQLRSSCHLQLGGSAGSAPRLSAQGTSAGPEGLQAAARCIFLGTGKGQVWLSAALLRASQHGDLQRQGQDREQAGTRQELGHPVRAATRAGPARVSSQGGDGCDMERSCCSGHPGTQNRIAAPHSQS